MKKFILACLSSCLILLFIAILYSYVFSYGTAVPDSTQVSFSEPALNSQTKKTDPMEVIINYINRRLGILYEGLKKQYSTAAASPSTDITASLPPSATIKPAPTLTPALTTPYIPSTPAEKFISRTSRSELETITSLATRLATQKFYFSSADELSSWDLYSFYTGVVPGEELYKYYKSDLCYHIPVKNITAVLDKYFDRYKFDASKISRDPGVNYFNKAEDAVVIPSCGSSWGSANTVERIRAVSDNIVELESVFYKSGDKPAADSLRMRLTIKIINDGYHYISFIKI